MESVPFLSVPSKKIEHFMIASPRDVNDAILVLQQQKQEHWWLDRDKPQRPKRMGRQRKTVPKWRMRWPVREKRIRKVPPSDLQQTEKDPTVIPNISLLQKAFTAWAWTMGVHSQSDDDFDIEKQYAPTSFEAHHASDASDVMLTDLLLKIEMEFQEALEAEDYLKAHLLQQQQRRVHERVALQQQQRRQELFLLQLKEQQLAAQETVDEEPAEEPEPLGPAQVQTSTAHSSKSDVEAIRHRSAARLQEEAMRHRSAARLQSAWRRSHKSKQEASILDQAALGNESIQDSAKSEVDESRSSVEPEAGPCPAVEKADVDIGAEVGVDVEGSAQSEVTWVEDATPECSQSRAAPMCAAAGETVTQECATVGQESITTVEKESDNVSPATLGLEAACRVQHEPSSSSDPPGLFRKIHMSAWNPRVRCGKYFAGERLGHVMDTTGKTEQDAKKQIMEEFSVEFFNDDTPGWQPKAMCAGYTAEDRAAWLREEEDGPLYWARLKVMSEHPWVFNDTIQAGWNPKAICGNFTAEEHACWLAETHRKSLAWAREKVMRDYPRKFRK